ncbi:MAG: RICIN domain-containing protein [Streptosporangiaceae bacterium]|nr:RICIN domain-containing protein [Streptosporangiaceae bacterium]
MPRTTGVYVFRIAVAGGLVAAAVGGAAATSAAGAVTVPCSVTSLISAISTANTTPASSSLTLTSGCAYTLTAADNATDGGTGLPVITGQVSIQGSGATITRSATAAFRLFDVASGGSLTLSDMTLSNGLINDGVNGGGAIFSHGPLSVTHTTFSGNSAPAATGISGGAINAVAALTVSLSTFTGNTAQEGGGILSQGTTSVTDTTFTGNTATQFGGGAIVVTTGTTTIARDTFSGNTGPGGGAIDNDTTVNVSNSTFTGNTAGSNGGGAIQNFGTATITQSTFSGNSSAFGANLHNLTTSGSMTVSQSIVANGAGGGGNCSGSPAIVDGGHNIDTGTSCGFSAANRSMSNTNPALGPLASNGGPTQTMALPSDSPAVNAIPATVAGCPGSTDQRGVSRPQGPACDIGAYELIAQTPPPPPPPPPAGGQIRGFGGTCLDDFHSGTVNRNKIDVYRCNGTAAQRWVLASDGELQVFGKCLDDPAFGHRGTRLVLFTCNGGANQRWTHTAGGQYVLAFRHLCLDDPGFSTANGTAVRVWSCDGGANQRWTRPA